MQPGRQKLWTISGPKGGVGESFLTASMATTLARMGKSVVAVDADLEEANLHAHLGFKSPPYTFVDFLESRAKPQEVVLHTPEPRLSIICGARDMLGMADPTFAGKEKVIQFIASLDAEYIVVDLGAGSSFNALDFFNSSDEAIIVITPDPFAMQNAHEFIRSAIFRKIQRVLGSNAAVLNASKEFQENCERHKELTMMEYYERLCEMDPDAAERVAAMVDNYHPLLLVNMANSEADERVAEIIQSAAKKFLNVEIEYCGLVFTDPRILESGPGKIRLNFDDPASTTARQIAETVIRLLDSSTPREEEETAESASVDPAKHITGLNDNLEVMGKELHVQTEDLGHTARYIITQVFYKGRILQSVKLDYPPTIGDSSDRNQIMELMRKQHFDTIRQIQDKKTKIIGSE